MSGRRILAILIKDLRDAWRDGRIVVLLLLPIGLAVFQNATLGDDDELPATNVAVVEQRDGGVASALRDAAGKSVEIELVRARDADSARSLVAGDDAEVAVVTAPSQPPRGDVLVAQDASPAAQSVVALVPDALASAAGRTPAARTDVSVVASADQEPYELLEAGALSALVMIALHLAFVATMVVPMQTAEELETGTFGALRLAASGPEILAAKALAGYVYGVAGAGLVVLLTGLEVHEPLLFFGATLALIVSLVGFGLLLGLLIRSAGAVNTYAGYLSVPVVALAGAVFAVDSGIFATILDLLPFSQAMKLLANGAAPQQPFEAGLLAWLVIALWALAGYAILARIATRREL